jgi:hypothetical protein
MLVVPYAKDAPTSDEQAGRFFMAFRRQPVLLARTGRNLSISPQVIGFMEASEGIEPPYKDLQSSA